ncbi:MAG TPA: hypothetical protein VNF99_12025 [Stellaceae bacterium]|nr:hypothetical protein [Stellaceae bacterium]
MLIDPRAFARLRVNDPLRLLTAPLEWLLACGGDTRLNLDPATQLNGYGCRPFPRPEAFTFASSTATSISSRAYAAVAGLRQSLLREARHAGIESAVDIQAERLRDELKQALGLDDSGCEVVFSPSGTDSQLHALFVARALLGTPLVSMIAAGDETGSGAAFATRGRHFNAITAQGVAVAKGDPIRGLAEGIAGIMVPLRDESGQLRPGEEVDGDIAHGVARSVAAGKRVLLFAMDSSKFGLRSPSLDCLRWIADASGGDVQIVIDACQARLGRRRLRWYLDQGFLVLVTGSKFFTGAPFSGALLVPSGLAARCASLADAPDGLGAYSGRSDWPAHFAGIRAALPVQINIGTLLRWASAIEEMRDYFAVPDAFRALALAQFAEIVPQLIAAEPCLEPIALPTDVTETLDDEEFAARTIFPFFIRRKGALLSHAQAGALYRALNEDVVSLLPATLPPMLRLLAARRCHIGQPVAVPDGKGGSVGALRISAGARVVSESWRDDMLAARENLHVEFDQVRAVIEKLALLARYFDTIEPAYAAGIIPTHYRVSAA